ncbi:Transcriptional regulator, LysR family [hydrothermal vent metagenome]|uniref:Transcriptional regulator, LysR family n=1 Tax=hydrothermal vent metagenome TaxID=652676 RepID=A0A3B1AD30_9ZZZZ
MDRLNSMHIFVEVVNGEGFTAAAEKIGLSRAQISKSVMQLEAHLGTRLLNRTTRRISLTEIGRIYYDRCKIILNDIEEIEGLAREQTSRPHGRLTISAPTSFGIFQLNAAIPQYIKEHPQVQISINLADRFIDVVSEGFDLVIRIAELEDSSLIARKIAPCKRVFCASPEYLEQQGTPAVPQDLAIHHCLIYSNELKPDTWVLHGPNGVESVKVNGPVCADNGDILKSAALSGLGISLLPSFIVGPEISAGRLQQVLLDYCPPEISIYAVFPSRRYLSAKVRTFVDFLAGYFGDNPDWDQFS